MRYKRDLGEYRIVDRVRLAELLTALHGRSPRSRGWQSALARRLDLGRSLLSKLLKRRQTHLARETFERIAAYVSAEDQAKLNSCVINAAMLGALGSYGDLLRSHDLEVSTELTNPTPPARTRPRSKGSPIYLVDGVPEGTRRDYAEMGRIRDLPEARAHFTEFREWVHKRGWPDEEEQPRREMAELQVLAPLLYGAKTFGVERTVKELRKTEDLGRYLKSALAAQRILLNRAQARERIAGLRPLVATGRGSSRASVLVHGRASRPEVESRRRTHHD